MVIYSTTSQDIIPLVFCHFCLADFSFRPGPQYPDFCCTYLAVLLAGPNVGEDGGVHAQVLHDDGLQVLHVGDGLVVDLAAVTLHHILHLLVSPLLNLGVLGKAVK